MTALAMRRALGRVVGAVPVRIRAGPNRGARWSLAAAGRHRTGTFERRRIDAILSLIRPGDCFWDIGAHHGYVTLAASTAVGTSGLVCSFEPSPYNFQYLSRHVRWNGRANVRLFNVGVDVEPGRVPFGGGGSSQTFRIGGGRQTAEMTSLAALNASQERSPDVLKIDIEGNEGAVLTRDAPRLPPTSAVVISVHSLENYSACVRALEAQGFRVMASPGVARARDLGVWGNDDPDILAFGPDRDGRRAAHVPGDWQAIRPEEG